MGHAARDPIKCLKKYTKVILGTVQIGLHVGVNSETVWNFTKKMQHKSLAGNFDHTEFIQARVLQIRVNVVFSQDMCGWPLVF